MFYCCGVLQNDLAEHLRIEQNHNYYCKLCRKRYYPHFYRHIETEKHQIKEQQYLLEVNNERNYEIVNDETLNETQNEEPVQNYEITTNEIGTEPHFVDIFGDPEQIVENNEPYLQEELLVAPQNTTQDDLNGWDSRVMEFLTFGGLTDTQTDTAAKLFYGGIPAGSCPKSRLLLDKHLESKKFQLKKFDVCDTTIWAYDIKDILVWLIKNQDMYDPMVWNYNFDGTYGHESNSILWQHLENRFGSPTIMVKPYLDQFELDKRTKKGANGLYFLIANHTHKDQMGLDGLFKIAYLPTNDDKNLVFEATRILLIDPIREMEAGFIVENELYKATIFITLGDHPGQNFWAGMYLLALRFCSCKNHLDAREFECFDTERTAEVMYHYLVAGNYFIEHRQNHLVLAAKEMLRELSLEETPSPFWKLESMFFQFPKRFGICSDHLLLEGIGRRLLKNVFMEPQPWENKTYLDLNQMLENYQYPTDIVYCRKVLVLGKSKVKKNAEGKPLEELKNGCWTAELSGIFWQFAPFLLPQLDLPVSHVELLISFSEILKLVYQINITGDQVDYLSTKIEDFQTSYREMFSHCKMNFPNLHSMRWIPRLIRFSGPMWTSDSMRGETGHGDPKSEGTGSQERFKTLLRKSEKKRRNGKKIFKKIGCTGKGQNLGEDLFGYEHLNFRGKQQRKGEYYAVEQDIFKVTLFITDKSDSLYALGWRFQKDIIEPVTKCFILKKSENQEIVNLSGTRKVCVVKYDNELLLNKYFWLSQRIM